MELTRDEFVEWRTSKATRVFLDIIGKRIEDLKEVLSGDCDEKISTNIRGQIMAFRSVLDTEYEDA
jgi:hypothetical protein